MVNSRRVLAAGVGIVVAVAGYMTSVRGLYQSSAPDWMLLVCLWGSWLAQCIFVPCSVVVLESVLGSRVSAVPALLWLLAALGAFGPGSVVSSGALFPALLLPICFLVLVVALMVMFRPGGPLQVVE